MIRFSATSLCSLLLLLPAVASAQATRPNLVGVIAKEWVSIDDRLKDLPNALAGQFAAGDMIAPRNSDGVVNVPESPLRIQNPVPVAAGEFEFKVYLSANDTRVICLPVEVTPNVWENPCGSTVDRLIHTDRISLGASETWRAERSRRNGSYPIQIPRNLTMEDTGIEPFLKVELDTLNEIAESDENNVFVSTSKLLLIGPDIVVGNDGQNSIVVVENDPPSENPEDVECYFGEDLLVSYQICNRGQRAIKGFKNKVIISQDMAFSIPGPIVTQTDTELETHPVQCVSAEEGLACAASGGACVDGVCHKFCSDTVNHSDCPADLFCADDLLLPYSAQPTCQNRLQPMGVAGRCYDYTRRRVTVPTVDAKGRPFAEGDYYIGVVINPEASNKVPETNTRNNSSAAQLTPFECRYPRADFTPVALDVPARMAAGETATVVRRIQNLGILEEGVDYRYVLSTNDFVSLDDVILPIESSGNGRTTIGRKGYSENTDLIRVPSTVLPGEYYLGIIVDGMNAVDELDERNNTFVATSRVVIEPSALRVITRFLPHATLGATYSHQLVAAGGIDTNRWTARGLPPGFTFSADGLLSGTPRKVGAYAITFEVTSGDVSATTMLGIRVLPPMGALAITTETLPPAILQTPYFAHIAAQGGEPFYDAQTGKASYRCKRTWGGMPDGIEDITENCDLAGTAQRIPAQASEFTIEVSDKSGNRASRTFTLAVVNKSELFIETQRLDEGAAGEPYGVDCATYPSMTARGARDGYNYIWSLEETSDLHKPSGLEFSTRVNSDGKNVGCLTGVPRECGSFLVPVRVTAVPDGEDTPRPEHDTDTATLPMNVICATAGLGNTDLPALERGQSLDHQLEVTGGEGARVSLFGGQLPSGITMTEDGLISGTVADDAPVGTYNFLVEVKDDEGGGAFVSMSIEILPTPGEDPKPPKEPGCGSSATGGGMSGALPFAVVLLGLVAAVFRRRAAAFVRISSFVAVIALAGSAQAQLQAGYRVTAPMPMAYEELPAGSLRAPPALSDQDWSASGDMWKVALPTGFNFRFFGRNFGYLGISGNGAIVPYTVLNPTPSGSTDYYVGITNTSFPSADGPAGLIAPWWDDFARSGSYSRPGGLYTRVDGETGSRVFKIQWKNLTHYACSSSSCSQARSYSFQTWIYEADTGLDSTIVFSYGTPIGPGNVPGAGSPTGYTGSSSTYMPSGSVGMESVDEDKGLTVLSCTPQCNFDNHFPTEQAVVITQKADVRMASVSGASTGWGGVPFLVQGNVQNVGRSATGPFTIEFFGSTDAVLDDSDVALGSSAPIANIASGSATAFTGQVTLPLELAPGSYYIIAKADVARAVNEDLRANNIGVHGPFVITDATPDATVESIELPASAATGSTFTLDWTVRNAGNAPIVGMAYDVYLSSNELISPSDRKVGSGVIDVDLLSTAPARVELTLPADVQPGRYHLGVILDPANAFAEVSKQNNAVASATTFPVVGGALGIAVTELAPAQLGSNYCVELTATGGDGNYSFELAEGSVLPPGLALVPESPATTLICGTPSQAGAFSFALKVSSAGQSVTEMVALVIHGTTAPLTIASVELPGAIYNTVYSAQLLAVGGQAPYRWSLVGGKLPQGLGLSGTGSISGAATTAGTFSLTVQVKDAAGEVALQAIDIWVSEPSRVTCLTTRLPSAAVGERLDVALLAAGGTEPYTWTAVETRRLAQGTDPGETLRVSSPPGIELSRDGVATGVPSVAGSYLWTVEVNDRSARERCLVMLDVVYAQGLTVVTRSLADVDVDVPYEVQLEASGGSGNLQWRLAPGSSLPEGLALDESGTISGRVSAALLGNDESRTFNFAVEARDGQNRTGIGALSIKVRRPLPEPSSGGSGDGGGCQAGTGAPGLLGMGLALGLALLRRRD